MATVQPGGYSYILMKDVQGEKAPVKGIANLGGVISRGSRPVQVLRGELLTSIPLSEMLLRGDGKPPHNFRSKKDPSVTMYVDDTNVAPAKGKEFCIAPVDSDMQAIAL